VREARSQTLKIDEQIAQLLELQAQGPVPSLELDGLEGMRAAYDAAGGALDPEPPAMAEVDELLIPAGEVPMPARMFTPTTLDDEPALIVWLHGGGWFQGSLVSHDSAYRRLAHASGVRVLGLQYPLAPEHPFPAALEAVESSLRWLHDQAEKLVLDTERLCLGGDSAGANLALVAGMELAREGCAPGLQVLLYPCLGPQLKTDSLHELAEGYGLTAKQMEQCYSLYLAEGQSHADPRVSPLLTPDLHEAPPTILAVAGFDPLRDEGLALSGLLESSGVAVTLFDEASLIHGFVRMCGVAEAARLAVDRIGAAVGEHLRAGT
jgi:acetyl esterase